MKQASELIAEILKIPCIDRELALGLIELGIYSIEDLKDASPDQLYHQLSTIRNQNLDKYFLYMLKCAVYYASHSKHDPELLKWRNWQEPRND
jgi:hypothetical protein